MWRWVCFVWVCDQYTRVVEGGVCIIRSVVIDSHPVRVAEYTFVVRRVVCISCVRVVRCVQGGDCVYLRCG